MTSRTAALLFALWARSVIAAPTACVACHPGEVQAHAKTAHASALLPVPKSLFAIHLLEGSAARKPLLEAPGGYAFTYRSASNGLVAEAHKDNRSADGLIQWVFGSGRRGQTPLIETGGHYLEHRVSFYAETGQYGITTGQENGISRDPLHALGILQSDSDLKSCLGCHSTGTLADQSNFQPGIQCARCHAGAEEHAAGRGRPVNPGKLDHVAQVQLCGTCHRVGPQPGHDNETSNVRFQPLRLMKSRCYLEGQIACTTCHAAHVDARRNEPAYYNAKCQQCHAGQQSHIAAVKSNDCISCHMPRRRPHPLLEFTDHFIRVVASK